MAPKKSKKAVIDIVITEQINPLESFVFQQSKISEQQISQNHKNNVFEQISNMNKQQSKMLVQQQQKKEEQIHVSQELIYIQNKEEQKNTQDFHQTINTIENIVIQPIVQKEGNIYIQVQQFVKSPVKKKKTIQDKVNKKTSKKSKPSITSNTFVVQVLQNQIKQEQLYKQKNDNNFEQIEQQKIPQKQFLIQNKVEESIIKQQLNRQINTEQKQDISLTNIQNEQQYQRKEQNILKLEQQSNKEQQAFDLNKIVEQQIVFVQSSNIKKKKQVKQGKKKVPSNKKKSQLKFQTIILIQPNIDQQIVKQQESNTLNSKQDEINIEQNSTYSIKQQQQQNIKNTNCQIIQEISSTHNFEKIQNQKIREQNKQIINNPIAQNNENKPQDDKNIDELIINPIDVVQNQVKQNKQHTQQQKIQIQQIQLNVVQKKKSQKKQLTKPPKSKTIKTQKIEKVNYQMQKLNQQIPQTNQKHSNPLDKDKQISKQIIKQIDVHKPEIRQTKTQKIIQIKQQKHQNKSQQKYQSKEVLKKDFLKMNSNNMNSASLSVLISKVVIKSKEYQQRIVVRQCISMMREDIHIKESKRILKNRCELIDPTLDKYIQQNIRLKKQLQRIVNIL